jgi:sarcosine oxidase, subunit alpha
VGLSPCDELLAKAQTLGLKVYAAGDTAEIAEASAAIFSGRIVGREIANDLGYAVPIPEEWPPMAALLRSRPGKTVPFTVQDRPEAVFPVIRCVQEIPCNPCEAACPEGLISLGASIMNLPEFRGGCLGCGACVTVCPGLAITLVFNDYDPSGAKALVMLPFEIGLDRVPLGRTVTTVDLGGAVVGEGTVIAVRERPEQDRRHLLLLEVPGKDKLAVAGFRLREATEPIATGEAAEADPIVCRCERVRRSAIVAEIRAGVRDVNQLKALTRLSLGGCAGKTCGDLLKRIFREEGVDPATVTPGTGRALLAEAPLSAFAPGKEGSHG